MRAIKLAADKASAEVLIYEDIGAGFFGGLTAKDFAKEIKQLPKTVKELNVRINSSGGDVFEGTAIYNTLRRQQATVTVDVDGAALSIASVIAMAASDGRLTMAENAFMMVHDPWSFVMGDAREMRKTAELLDNVKEQIVQTYASRTGLSVAEISDLMAEETWLNASDAVEMGFADQTTESLAVAASATGKWCRKVPEAYEHLRRIHDEAHRSRCQELKNRLDKSGR